MATRFSDPASQFFDKATKAPLAGGQLFFFEPGSDTPKPTFSDSLGVVPNTQPVILDGNGVMPDVFGDGSYRVVLRASPIAPATLGVQQWERDPVVFSMGAGSFSEWVETVTYEINSIVEAADGAFYIAIAQSTNANPTGGANPASWSRFDLLNRWNSDENYVVQDVVRGTDGIMYTAVQNSLNVDPVVDTDASHWKMFDNIRIDGNTISATNTDGSLTLNPNGTGALLSNTIPIGLAPVTLQTFSANNTWNRPANVKFVIIEGVGGGGAGGGGILSNVGHGQGGGGSGYFRDVVDVSATASLTVTIGAGGAGVMGAAGLAGSNTIVDDGASLVLTANGGGAGALGSVNSITNPNNGATATGAAFIVNGSSGELGYRDQSNISNLNSGGSGGGSHLGRRTVGPQSINPGGNIDGNIGNGRGSGGSGAAGGAGTHPAIMGGDGGGGFVAITEYR